jgi:hypothetical protein
MTYEEVVTGLHTLVSSDFDLNNVDANGAEKLSELTDGLMELHPPNEQSKSCSP